MRTKRQTSIHLLLASIVTTFGMMLILIAMALSWELWMIPVILIGNTLVWCLRIGRIGSEAFYEHLCSGLLMVGFFFFGVHEATLFDIPSVACMIILIFSMFNKKRLLYMTAALYVLELMYHFFILHTITYDMGTQNIIRLAIGPTVVVGAMVIAVYRIKRRREAKAKFDSTVVELETAGRQNAEFLSNVSHELRTPINMVLGISEVILEKDISPEIRADMQSIQLAGKRLSHQINNMLDYTEIVEGTLTPAKEPYRITSVLNDIITMTAMQSGKHQLEMVFDMDPKMPSVLIGDVEKIAHILKILLENSIKFTEEGGVNVCIEYRPESYGVNLVIDICDTGIGMEDSQITQICNDFYQADSGSSRIAGGLGLGLPIARGLLHAMGGFMHFNSNDQQGLQIQITIPQGVADYTPSMILSHPESLCIACYFRPEKYNSDEVRRYYDRMIFHMVKGLHVEGYQAHNFEGLVKLRHDHALTHVFITQAEYEEDIAYYEDWAGTLQVIVIAEHGFLLNKGSRLLVIHKPFSALSVVNLLNGEMKANGFEEAQAAGRKPFSCEGVRVLTVDDEEMNLVVAKGVLGSYGIQVDTCLSGKEAVEQCANTAYDIVFLDHMMPGFDGVETLKQIREIKNGIYKELPVIALTANTISGAREMFRNEGFTEFIPKPIERAVLERVLRKVLPMNQVHYGETPMNAEEPLPVHYGKTSVNPAGPLPDYYGESPEITQEPSKEAARPSPNSKKSRRKRKKDSQKGNISKNAIPEKTGQDKVPLEGARPNGERLKEKAPVPNQSLLAEKALGRPSPDERRQEELRQEERRREERRKEERREELRQEERRREEYRQEERHKEEFRKEERRREELRQEECRREERRREELRKEERREERRRDERFLDAPLEEESTQAEALTDNSSIPYHDLIHIGINVQLGLDYCCGEEEFYLEMLRMFHSQAKEKKAEIISLYETANWEDYIVKVRALKSTSLTIGAERLAEQAKMLEQAGKSGNIKYIRHSHPILLRLYDEICDTIAGL